MHSSQVLVSFWAVWAIQACLVAAQVMPQVRGTPFVVANVTDPSRSRDSCGSVRVGNRALWVCRDTTGYHDGQAQGPIAPNSASWTDFDGAGNPLINHNASVGAASNGSNPVLLMYGGSYNETMPLPFYPLDSDECLPRGFCKNKTNRFAVWPDQPPMVTAKAADGTVTAYTWISQNLIVGGNNLSQVYPSQPHSLWRFVYTPPTSDQDAAPQPQLINASFWGVDEWGYGAHGQVVRNGTAYLYAQNDGRSEVAIAQVAVNSIEDKSQYSYYVNKTWTSVMPALNDSSAFIPQIGRAWHGTFWYSEAFGTYIWIGEDPSISSTQGQIDFVLSTAPNPEGPWITPYYLNFSQPRGTTGAGAYSIQAHPDLIAHPTTNRSIYLTYTFHQSGYTTPLIFMQLH